MRSHEVSRGTMANIPAVISYTIEDGLGLKSSNALHVNVADTTILSALVTEIDALGTLIEPLTSGHIVEGRIRLNSPKNDYGAADGDSRVAEAGVFNFSNTVTSYLWGLAISAFNDALLVGGKIPVDQANVAALATHLITHPAFVTGNYTNNSYQNLLALVDTFLSDRKSASRALRRASRAF